MKIFDMLKKKVVGSHSHADAMSSREAQEREFKGFRVGVEPMVSRDDAYPRGGHHYRTSSPCPCRNGSLDRSPYTPEQHASEGSAHSSSRRTPRASNRGTCNQVWFSSKVLKVLGADENEEEKILSYMKEHVANERWTSTSDSETLEQSASGSPRGELSATERPMFYSTKSAAPEVFTAGATVLPQGQDGCFGMCNNPSIHPRANGIKPLGRFKSEPLLSNNIVQNLYGMRSSTPTVLLNPHLESEESTGTGKGTPWEMSGSSTPQRSPKGQSSPVLPPASLHERFYQPLKLAPPPFPPCEQLVQSSHGAAAGMKLGVNADWMRSNRGLNCLRFLLISLPPHTRCLILLANLLVIPLPKDHQADHPICPPSDPLPILWL